MPQPVRSVLGSRLGSLLLIILAPILVVTGVISIQWDSGVPKVSIDRERAKEIKVKAVDSLQKLREKEDGLLKSRPGFAAGEEDSKPALKQDERPIANLSEILRTMR
jgi:hypothetical protein